MAMPLTDRNLAICALCTDCIEGRGCRYVRKSVGVKFSIPRYARHIEKIVRIKKSRYIKKPDNEKFITFEKRVACKTRRAIALGKIQRPEICQKCGKKGKVDAHHPDYRTEKLEFLCRACHNKEARKGQYHLPLNEVAKQRRLNFLVEKYGVKIKDLFLNFYDHPELSKADLGELIGVTCERIRQLLIQIHGTSKKSKLLLKCGAIKNSFGQNSYAAEIFDILISMGYEPQKTKVSYNQSFLKLKNGISVTIRKLSFNRITNQIRFNYGFTQKADYVIGKYEDENYIAPIKKDCPLNWMIDKRKFSQYKEAWHLLEQPK